MGALGDILPQGPNRHCGNLEEHPKHLNMAPRMKVADRLGIPETPDGTWCDGIPPLMEFVEVVLRVPLTAYFGEEGPQGAGLNHEETLAALGEETGHVSFMVEFADAPGASCSVRLRACGRDKVYQAAAGEWPKP